MRLLHQSLADLINRKNQPYAAAMTAVFFSSPAMAAEGLAKGQSTLQMIKDKLELILPIAAFSIGLIIVVLYMAEIMRKDDMVRWLIGLVIAGSIGEIVVPL